jgi:predicted  nucleic acid-binding Zn-ribbon protein
VSYADQHHDHRGYAEDRHDHYNDYAEKHHGHYDDESTAKGLREDLGRSGERIRQLEDDLRDALNRIHALEDRQPDYAREDGDHDDCEPAL